MTYRPFHNAYSQFYVIVLRLHVLTNAQNIWTFLLRKQPFIEQVFVKTADEHVNKYQKTWYFDTITVEHHLLRISNSVIQLKVQQECEFVVVSFCSDMCRTCTVGKPGPKFKPLRYDSSTTWGENFVSPLKSQSIKPTHIKVLIYVIPTAFKSSLWPWVIIYRHAFQGGVLFQ